MSLDNIFYPVVHGQIETNECRVDSYENNEETQAASDAPGSVSQLLRLLEDGAVAHSRPHTVTQLA